MNRPKRYAAAVAVVTGALAIAGPIGEASAATTPGLLPGWDPSVLPYLPTFNGLPASMLTPTFGATTFSKGPTVVNSVFNGATVVTVVNDGPAFSSLFGSP